MAKTAGRKALVKVSGVAITLTAEATTDAGAHLVYQITNSAKRVLDPQYAVTVLEDGVTSVAAWSVNRLNGTITFTVARGGSVVVTVTGKYLPLSNAASAKAHTFTFSGKNDDVSEYGDTWVSRLPVQKDASGSLGSFRTSSTYWEDTLFAGLPVVLEFYSDSSGNPDFLAWALLNKQTVTIAQAAVQEQSIDWDGAADADGRVISTP